MNGEVAQDIMDYPDGRSFDGMPWDDFLDELTSGPRESFDSWFEEFNTDLLLPWRDFLPTIISELKNHFAGFRGGSLRELREYARNKDQRRYVYIITSVIQNLLTKEDKKLATHSRNVANVTRKILANLKRNGTKISKESQMNIFAGAAIHDFGKLTWPKRMFEKNRKYGPEENMIKVDHVWNGYHLAVALGLPTEVCDIALRHHQKNGTNQSPESNYPIETPNWVRVAGVRTPDLPKYGPGLHLRIPMVADTMVTMIDARYQDASTIEEILEELKAHSDFFGHEVVSAAMEVVKSPEFVTVLVDRDV